eukprot:GFUD01012191.1.p1 GENE.GFUD01012191.1~~GFUD01012191.1.p1  ORF type:complete len:218 (-),score=72.66 GFUD01012191.1:174-827(-)
MKCVAVLIVVVVMVGCGQAQQDRWAQSSEDKEFWANIEKEKEEKRIEKEARDEEYDKERAEDRWFFLKIFGGIGVFFFFLVVLGLCCAFKQKIQALDPRNMVGQLDTRTQLAGLGVVAAGEYMERREEKEDEERIAQMQGVGGYDPVPQQGGGYAPGPQQGGGFAPFPQQAGGYAPVPQQSGGYAPDTLQAGGYPPQSGFVMQPVYDPNQHPAYPPQ